MRLTHPGMLAFMIATVAACSPTSTVSRESTNIKGEMTFIVGSSADGEMVSGVDVFAAKPSGLLLLGKTGTDGRLSVPKARLADASAVLFCEPKFFCGAFRTSESRFLGYTERFITLAPGAVL